MARFDVYPNPRKATAKRTPCLLDVQSDFLEGLETCVVVPLRAASVIDAPVTRLNPALDIAGVKVDNAPPEWTPLNWPAIRAAA